MYLAESFGTVVVAGSSAMPGQVVNIASIG